MKRQPPVNLFACCAAIFVASFMPWATNSIGFPAFGAIESLSTGWSGNLNMLGIIVPNWVSILIAGALAGYGWMREGEANIDPQIPYRLALVGAAHSLFYIAMVLLNFTSSRLGLGVIVTFAAFVAMVRMLKENQLPATVAVESTGAVSSDTTSD